MQEVTAINGSFRQTYTTGAVTTIAAGTATAGFLFALRWTDPASVLRLRSLEVEFILTTAFGTPQEVGFDVFPARSYSASASGATAITVGVNDGKSNSAFRSSAIRPGNIRVADAGALTAGTQTLDSQSIARGSCWGNPIGAVLPARYFDYTDLPIGGFIFGANEGFIIRNTIVMGATGVGKWHFTLEWDEVTLGS